jgi:outer membrane autotransporter protein
VALYSTLPSFALRYGSMLLDSLHERRGDDRRPGYGGPGSIGAPFIWGRAVGEHGRQVCSLNRDKTLDYDLFAFQGGVDLYGAEGSKGESDVAGVYGAIGTGNGGSNLVDVSIGSSNLNAYSIGGYWRHYGTEGWYLDGVLQGTWYDTTTDSTRPFSLSTNGVGLGASLEAGYPFPVTDGWVIEPQAQLAYQYIDFDDASDSAAEVSFSGVTSLIGRVGARIAKTWELGPGEARPRLITGWLRASLAYEFLDEPTTSFSSANGPVPFPGDFSGPSVILNAGLDAELRENVALYTDVNYEAAFDSLGESIGGEVGLKVRW